MEQIVLLLVFILVPLLNLLVGWLQRRARERGAREAAARAAAADAREPQRPITMPRVRRVEPAPSGEGRRAAPAPLPRSPQPARRRAGPLGGPAAVRRAIVTMTILDQCRGLEAPRPLPSPPRRQ